MERGRISLQNIKYVLLEEADRMLDMRCASLRTGCYFTSRACHIGGWLLQLSMARVCAGVSQHMPRAYWDYDSANVFRVPWRTMESFVRSVCL